MLNYNDIIKVSKQYLEIADTMITEISIIENFIKYIVYPSLCNFVGRNFHMIINDGYCSGLNTLSTVEITSNPSTVDDYYKDYYFEIISGFNAGERKKITAYDADTNTITLESDLLDIPDASSRYAILLFNDESFINSQNVFVDGELVFPPAQLTPINQILSQEFLLISDNVIKLDIEQYSLNKIYNIRHIYGYFDYLRDVETILVMILQDFWKRKGKHGLQGITSRTINLEDTLVEQNYLKEIFTSSYRVQLAKYIVPYEKRSWN
jgi:hypothetical protein